MTFGIGSPGFDPFHCPDIPEGEMWNILCIDLFDTLILLAGVMVLYVTISAVWNTRVNNDE